MKRKKKKAATYDRQAVFFQKPAQHMCRMQIVFCRESMNAEEGDEEDS